MIGVKKNVIVFFGLFLIGMLFVPPGIPFMVPEAEAQGQPNLYWTNISITSSSGGTTITPGDTAHIEATLVCINCVTAPSSRGQIFYPDDIGYDGTANTAGTLREDFSWANTSLSPQGTVLTKDILMHANSDTIAGDYTVKLIADYQESLDESNESDNIIIGTMHVGPPVPPSGTVTIEYPVTIEAFNPGTTNPTPAGRGCMQIGTWDAATLTCTLTADIIVTSNRGAIKLGQAIYSGYTGSTAGITIDGAGHTITGTGGGQMSDAGIYFYKTHQVVVKNLVIENFKVGINSHQTNGVTITGNTIKDSHYGMYVYQTGTCPNCGSGVAITNNTVENSGSNQGSSSILVQGFEGDGTCNTSIPYFHPEYAAGPPGNNPTPVTVKGNTITGGGGWGITLDAAGACVDSNTVTGKQSAMNISGPGYSNAQSNNNIISNNVVTSSTNDGIVVVGSGNTIDSNTVSNSQYYSGFSFDSRSHNNIITNNVANNNAQYGFEFEDGSDVASHTFTGNTASGNNSGDFEGISTLTPTCFASSGYQILAPGIQVQSPPGSGNMVTLTTQHVMFHGKLQPNSDGTCTLSNSLFLADKTVAVSATKGGSAKNIPGTTDSSGFFSILHPFSESTDEGTWTITYHFLTGDPEYDAFSSASSTINVPAPPPPTSNVDLSFNLTPDVTPYPNGTTLFSRGVGTGAQIQMQIVNTGTGTALDNWANVKILAPNGSVFADQDVQFGYAIGPNSPHGAAWVHQQFDSSTALGTYSYTVTIDPDNLVDETNENNNVHTGSFEVVEGAQLPVDLSFNLTPDVTPYPNGTTLFSRGVGTGAQIQMQIVNTGTGTALDNWANVKILAPNGSVFADQDVQFGYAIGPNSPHGAAWVHQQFDSSTALGTYSYTVTIDPDNLVDETNENNNVHTGSFEVVSELPIITMPADISSSSINASGMAVTFDVTATDNAAVTIDPTCDPASGSTFPIGTTTVTCTASDNFGNTTTETFTVTLAYTPLDNEAPTITVPSTITVTTSNAAGAAATWNQVTASDNVGVTTGPTCGVASGSNFAIGDTIVTCTASDAEGNTATETFTVTVQLADPPTISIPWVSDHTFFVNTGVFSTPVYYPQLTASSSLGIASGPTCTPSSNSQFSVGTTIVSCTATDSHGTAGTTTFTVAVLQLPPLTDAECIALAGSGHDASSLFVCEFPFNVTVEENQRLVWVDRQPWQGFYRHSITSSTGLFDHYDAGVMDMLPSAWGGVGTYSFYDKVNPSLTGSITIAESDTTNPTVTVPSDMTVSTDTPTGTPTITYSVSASDDREVTSGPTCTPASGTNFSVGTTTVTCSASDAAGNTGTSSFTVTVEYTFVDETPPGLTPPSGITLATTNPSGTVVTYTGVTATDNVAVTSGPTCTPASGTIFPIGITEVTCTATDAAGNEGSTSFTVTITQTIIDGSAPAITVSNNISQTTTSSSGKIVTYQAPTAVDNVGVTIGPTCTPASGSLFAVGMTTVSCSASDAAGNTATVSFTVTIINTAAVGDTTPPTLSQPSNIVQNANLSNGAIVTYSIPTATDDTAVTFGPSCTPRSGSLFSVGTTIVTCTAKDAAGNQGSVSFNVIVTQPIAGQDNTITLQLDKSSYFTGDPINITGVATGDTVDIVLAVIAPNGELISINQVTPGSTSMLQSSTGSLTILNTVGSSFEGCEQTNSCFAPSTATIQSGETITWENPDDVPHTVTSGSPFGGPDGYFNSGLISVGSSFSQQFNASGTYDYYCIVHPWMQGTVIVESTSASTPPAESGSFTTQIITLGPLWSQEGSYTVNASYGQATATKTFNFTVRELDAIPFTSVPSDIALSINKNSYTGDETISINAVLVDGSADQPISIEINDPVGAPLFLQTLNTNSQARVSSQFTLPENVVSGTYTVSASSKGTLWNLTESVAFTGIPLEPGILDSSISVTDELGEAVTTYNAGDLGYFSTKMTTKSTSQILVTVSVLDAQQNTLGVGFFKTVLPKGEAEIVLGFDIPEGTISGDAQVFTNFFTDWPDQGGIQLGEEISSKVNIIGVEPVEEVVELLEEPVQMQVTVQNAPGSSYPGCEETNSCFLPSIVTIDLGGTVTWENTDTAAHTATAGTAQNGPSGHFDSSLMMAGGSFSHTFDTAGTYDYFCMVHPWMQGQVVVGGSDEVVEPIIEPTPVFDPESVVIPESTSEHGIVVNAPGSSTPGCEETNSCFLPSTVIIDLGGTVTWENTDTAAHTATAGTAQNGPSGHFDSSLMMVGGSFSHTFDTAGTYDYFCMVHPWMTGQVVVGESDTVVEPVIEEEPMPESSGMQVTVQNAPGSSFEGCEPDCFLPSTVTIDLGGTVTWENPDNVPHTMTSGTSADGPDGHFDSSLIMVGQNYSNTFDEAGTYNYFCMIHPWMQGSVVVGGSDTVVEPVIEQESSGMQATVQNAPGSSTPGCEETNSCFLPSIVTIDLGGTVTWENQEVVAHTTTSFKGSISGVIGLEWDSGLMLSGESFSHMFDTEGVYDYFCMVHPWMVGQIVVQPKEEVAPEPIGEEVVEVVDILALNAASNIIQLSDAEYLSVDKPSLNDVYEKLTISSWIKPNFISTAGPQYSAVSKEGSFELFVTNTKEPTTSPGFSVYNGITWNTILIDSKIPDDWHHLVGVIDGSELSLYLDSVLIGTKSILPHYVFNDHGQLIQKTAYMATSENDVVVGALLDSVNPLQFAATHQFEGSISDVNVITDALDGKQVSNLYNKDKNMFQRGLIEVQSVINGTVTTTFANTESPKLSASECAELANEMELDYNDNYTLICEFPFDVIIPINSRILWMETLDLEDAPYHSIRSVDDVFGTGSMVSADMDFYDNVFTSGVYEYYDDFDESLTGKIIISKSTNNININEGSVHHSCADDYSCYDTFAAQVNVGEEVTWTNQDTEVHTVTSGTPADGPDGLFDSGLIENYMYFYHTFDEPGTYDYFCMIHPWMQGKVVVGEI